MAGGVSALELPTQPLQEGWLRAVCASQWRFHARPGALTELEVLGLEAHGEAWDARVVDAEPGPGPGRDAGPERRAVCRLAAFPCGSLQACLGQACAEVVFCNSLPSAYAPSGSLGPRA